MSQTSDNSNDSTRNAAEANRKPLAPKKAGASAKKAAPRADADLMPFKECANDGSVHVKTISRWVKLGYLTEWRPHPKSRTRRIKREVWDAFKQRRK
jgi:hypothetical protein